MDPVYGNHSIWKSYLIMKEHFPNMSPTKERFFKELCKSLPMASDPEIQSCNGL